VLTTATVLAIIGMKLRRPSRVSAASPEIIKMTRLARGCGHNLQMLSVIKIE
jgi:hypothetical protein